MRDKWYSDNRDLVKWSALLHIARKHLSDSILYIAYLRQSHYGKIEVDGKEYEIPSEVISQFRNIRNITKMTSQPILRIFYDEFGDRNAHLNNIKNLIMENYKRERCMVFLDPDTGLEPSGKVSHNHVLMRGLKESGMNCYQAG